MIERAVRGRPGHFAAQRHGHTDPAAAQLLLTDPYPACALVRFTAQKA
jgi:hypothetical protein